MEYRRLYTNFIFGCNISLPNGLIDEIPRPEMNYFHTELNFLFCGFSHDICETVLSQKGDKEQPLPVI